MSVQIDVEECIGCSLCVIVCPVDAMTAEGVAVVDEEECTDCLECVENCPVDAVKEG